jgi:hypothetical protein
MPNYYDNWREEEFDCPVCKWHGPGSALSFAVSVVGQQSALLHRWAPPADNLLVSGRTISVYFDGSLSPSDGGQSPFSPGTFSKTAVAAEKRFDLRFQRDRCLVVTAYDAMRLLFHP